MNRSTAYILTLISVILVGVVVATRFFGIHVPVIGPIVRGHDLNFTLLAYVLLLLPAIFR